MRVELSELKAIMQRSGAVAAIYIEPMNDAMSEFAINNAGRQAAWLANVAVESAELTRMSENLHYTTARRIADVWPSRFPKESLAEPYVNQPEKLANVVYAGRNGNGPIESGDGWRFRGGGGLMLTGRGIIGACADHFSMDIDQCAQWIRTPTGAMRSAAWYWWSRALNALADQEAFTAIVRKINPALLDLPRRREYNAVARRVLVAD